MAPTLTNSRSLFLSKKWLSLRTRTSPNRVTVPTQVGKAKGVAQRSFLAVAITSSRTSSLICWRTAGETYGTLTRLGSAVTGAKADTGADVAAGAAAAARAASL